MTELEKKLLLTEDEYNYLMERLGYESSLVQKPITKQINYYFDTDDLVMNRKNTTCRIRLKDGEYKAIMKQHSSNTDQSTETEMEIYKGLDNNSFTDMGLKLQGELVTERCVILKNIGCEAVLDKNEYLGHTDYELEIEYLPEFENYAQTIYRIILDMLTQRKCLLAYKESYEHKPSAPSKSNRFFGRRATMEENKKIANNPNNHINSSANYMDDYPYETLNGQDPDEYLDKYFYPHEYNESVCFSCVHWNGTNCDADYGRCEYEHY